VASGVVGAPFLANGCLCFQINSMGHNDSLCAEFCIMSSSSDSDNDSSVGSVNPEDHLADPDTLEDPFVDDDNYWLSEDHIFELQTERDPASKTPPSTERLD